MSVSIKTELMDHQQKSVDFALNTPKMSPCKRACFWLDIGTGKTLAALATIARFGSEGTLVVCPASVLRSWREEITKHTSMSYVEVTGYEGGRPLDLYQRKTDIYLVNYESLKVLFSKMASDGVRSRKRRIVSYFGHLPFDTVIFDECHHLSNPTALQTEIACKLSRDVAHVLMLTGTPTVSGLANLWAQFFVLDGGETLGFYYRRFLQRFFEPYTLHTRNRDVTKWREKPGAREEVLKIVSKRVIAIDRKDCFDLPEISETVREVELGSDQKQAIRTMVNGLKMKLKRGELNPANIRNASMKLRQIAGGFVIGSRGAERFTPNPKLIELWETLQQVPGKCIVYHAFVEEGRMIEECCEAKGIRFASMRGEITDKSDQYQSFKNDSEVKVLIAHRKSGGEGQNLQEANVIINWSNAMVAPGVRMQSIGRIHRLGQTKPCLVIDFVARGSPDEPVLDSLRKRTEVEGAVLDWIKNFRS